MTNSWSKKEEFERFKRELLALSDRFDNVDIPYLWITAIRNDGERTEFSILGNNIGEDSPPNIIFFKMLLDNPDIMYFLMENFPVIMAALKTGHGMADKMKLPPLDVVLRINPDISIDVMDDDINNIDVPDEFSDFLNNLLRKK